LERLEQWVNSIADIFTAFVLFLGHQITQRFMMIVGFRFGILVTDDIPLFVFAMAEFLKLLS
jgi:hypothetical protein